jgi:histidyl-tRNA synthetase
MAGSTLPGFRDFYPEDFAQRAHIFGAWREVARRHAFVEYDGPPLEPLSLYTEKSGDEIVGQLYNFIDKGQREVALRPEMTPTFARMVAERANALRKPVRWFSIPQLFRYERTQRGRLREHFQLNVDIVGEPSEVADAELLSVAIDVMRQLGLGPTDVRARISDRRLLSSILSRIGLHDAQIRGVFSVIDRFERTPPAESFEFLAGLGLSAEQVHVVIMLTEKPSIETLFQMFDSDGELGERFSSISRYFTHLEALGIREWVEFDPTIVRGLAYYTGIVFELFDAHGEFRAICGGGRYDTLLRSLGGVDLPALGFGMGDVVLGELLKSRGLMPRTSGTGAELFVVGGRGAAYHRVGPAMRLASVLRGFGTSVDYSLNIEGYELKQFRNQIDSAKKSGARAAIFFDDFASVTVQSLSGKLSDAPSFVFPAPPLLDAIPPAVIEFQRLLRGLLAHPPSVDTSHSRYQ